MADIANTPSEGANAYLAEHSLAAATCRVRRHLWDERHADRHYHKDGGYHEWIPCARDCGCYLFEEFDAQYWRRRRAIKYPKKKDHPEQKGYLKDPGEGRDTVEDKVALRRALNLAAASRRKAAKKADRHLKAA